MTMATLRAPLAMPRTGTVPSISAMKAASLGLRASNSSSMRGRPPVMSLLLNARARQAGQHLAGLDLDRRPATPRHDDGARRSGCRWR